MSTELPSDKYPLLVVIEGLVFDKQREHKERERSTAIAAKQPLSLSPNHFLRRQAVSGSPKLQAQNFGCDLLRSAAAVR
jgi:hypothetical protein